VEPFQQEEPHYICQQIHETFLCCVSLNVNNVLTWHGYIVILFFVDRAFSVIATLYNIITVRFTLHIHLPLTNGQVQQRTLVGCSNILITTVVKLFHGNCCHFHSDGHSQLKQYLWRFGHWRNIFSCYQWITMLLPF
jgi:hypothetical protein